jgi:hypothetical protein
MRAKVPLLLNCTRVANRELNNCEVARAGNAQISVGVYDLSWPVLGDNVKEIVHGNAEGLSKSSLNPFGNRSSMFRCCGSRDRNPDERHLSYSESLFLAKRI